MNLDNAYELLFTISLCLIGVCLLLVVIKSILGPRISDRLMTINMIGTLVTSSIAILSVFLVKEEFLVDVCLIYVLISFLSVVVFTTIFINEYIKKEKSKKEEDK